MAHPPRRPNGPGPHLAGAALIGSTLAVVAVTGFAVITDTPAEGLLLVAESGFGAGLLGLGLAGLFTCAAFATSFTAPLETPRGGSARPLPARVRIRRIGGRR
ncbi:hypothetical protein [Rhodoplanes azumiensis]|uniref:Uncharacterized protein n=1 Tax=Rhodoplanes azumiensis TaxID=1897628 RepID=A0ABW5AMG6_9BRAD